MFFEVRTKRLTVTERNAYKTVKELWLFQVESYTEAEARVTEFMNKQFKGPGRATGMEARHLRLWPVVVREL